MADITQASSRHRQGNNVPGKPDPASDGVDHETPPPPEPSASPDPNDLLASEQPGPTEATSDLISYAELLFFAYRDFVSEPDAILETYGFGRAHHRVLHFVHRSPGLRVAQLLNIIKITKQSVARVLKQLIDEEFITQRAGKMDGRERLLFVTPKGGKLAEELAALQVERIKNALNQAGTGTDIATRRFLFAMISEDEQQHVASLIAPPSDTVSSENDPTND